VAAHRAGLRRVIVPRENRKDIDDIPQRARREMAFTFVDHVDQVLNVALKREVRPERAQVAKIARGARRPRGEVAASAP